MKNKEKYVSIQFKMIVIVGSFLLLAAGGIFVMFGIKFYSVYRTQALSHMTDITSLASENVENRINQLDQLSITILADHAVQTNLTKINKASGDPTAEAVIRKCKTEIINQIQPSVFSLDGVISLRIYSATDEQILVGTTNREYLEYSLTPEEIYRANGAALWQMAGDNHYICMCRAIESLENMKILGYMVIVCKNEYFSKNMKTFPGKTTGKLYLMDSSGLIMSSNQESQTGKKFPYTPEELENQKNTYIKDPVENEQSVFFAGNKLNNGWTVVSTVSTEMLMQTLQNSLIHMLFLFTVVMLVFFMIIRIVIRKIFAPTKQLLHCMNQFGNGNLHIRVNVSGHDEIGRIGNSYNQMADNIQRLYEQVYSLELANKEAEIEFLKMQINPHFLYNTLDTISWMGYTNGCEQISDLAVSLAQLLRSSIKEDDFITVKGEIKIISNYLVIQGYRFEDRFSVKYEIEENVKGYYMPHFLLQPIVENSVIHGLENQLVKGSMCIRIYQDKNWLNVSVSDDGRGMTEEQVNHLIEQCKMLKSGNSIGLKNVYRRLQLLYGDKCNFEIQSEPEKGTTVSFRVPVIKDRSQTGIINTMKERTNG